MHAGYGACTQVRLNMHRHPARLDEGVLALQDVRTCLLLRLDGYPQVLGHLDVEEVAPVCRHVRVRLGWGWGEKGVCRGDPAKHETHGHSWHCCCQGDPWRARICLASAPTHNALPVSPLPAGLVQHAPPTLISLLSPHLLVKQLRLSPWRWPLPRPASWPAGPAGGAPPPPGAPAPAACIAL